MVFDADCSALPDPFKKVAIHKKIGKLSYLLVPLLLFSTIDLFKYRLQGIVTLRSVDHFGVALVLNALVVFIILYVLAIYHKKKGNHSCEVYALHGISYVSAHNRPYYRYSFPLFIKLRSCSGWKSHGAYIWLCIGRYFTDHFMYLGLAIS